MMLGGVEFCVGGVGFRVVSWGFGCWTGLVEYGFGVICLGGCCGWCVGLFVLFGWYWCGCDFGCLWFWFVGLGFGV